MPMVTSCGSTTDKVDYNLNCSALIVAANNLSVQGQIEVDPSFAEKALFSQMMHLNSYAIPNGIGEAEAFKQLATQREALLLAKSPKSIRNEAEACIRKTPQQ